MLGAIIGDVVGSRFEWHNHRSKDFEFFHGMCEFTDDSVMTLAIGYAVAKAQNNCEKASKLAVKYMQALGDIYPDGGYGSHFSYWLKEKCPEPYNSYGNGSAMRVSACGYMGRTLEEVKALSHAVTAVTHNHPEGLKGAEATAVAIFLARKGKSQQEIKDYICENYYDINFTLDEIRPTYQFNETCQETVPQALQAFFEAKDFEDAIRNAISIGGDSDTVAAITGSIAEAYFGIPIKIKKGVFEYLDKEQKDILTYCYAYMKKINE